MKRSIHLYIGSLEAEFSTVPDILYTFKVDDLTSPAAVRNSYSKTITLPGTKQNNKIFGQYWASDRLTGANYDATRKTPFTLYVDNEVYQTGYCRLTEINQNKNSVTYSVSLFGGLGEFFANLEYSDNDAGTDEKKKISDLTFFPTENESYGLDIGFEIDRDTVEDAWYFIDNDYTQWSVINFAPAYNGVPSDFDSNKVLMNVGVDQSVHVVDGVPSRPAGGRGSVVVTSVTEGGETYSTYGGYALGELSRDYTGSEMREFRSYLQRPVLRVKKVIDAIARPENNGGWKVRLDPTWFSADNCCYYNDLWVTLPLLSNLDYTSAVVSSGTTVYLGEKGSGNITTGDPGYYEDVLAYLEGGDNGMSYDVNVKLTLDINGVSPNNGNDMMICVYSQNQRMYYQSAIFVQLVAVDPMGSYVAGSEIYYITSPYGTRRVGQGANMTVTSMTANPSDWRYNVPYGNEYINGGTGMFDYNGSGYRWEKEISLTAKNVPPGSTLKILTTKLYKTGGSYNDAKRCFSATAPAGQSITYTAHTFNNFTVSLNSSKVAFRSNEGIRTGAAFSKKQLLDTDYSPCDFLLSYAKIFGLYFLTDPIKKEVQILTRDNFFLKDQVVDIQDSIDRQNVKTTPLVFDSKWYDWNLDADESEYGKAYENTYGQKYGQQKINTDFNFNRETKEVLEGNIFKNAVQVLERSAAYCYTDKDKSSKPWMFPGYSYLLYNTSDSTDTYEVTVPASSTIDAFSGFTEGYLYYDLFDKVQLHTADNSPADGKNVLLIHTGSKQLTAGNTDLNYFITDDNSYMNILNGGTPCWLFTNSETDLQGIEIAKKITSVPYFSRYRITDGTNYIIKSLDFGRPNELYIPGAVYRPDSTIYEQFWKTYISDLYDKNTRILKTKVLIKEKPTLEWLRRFYWFDECIWRMTSINDYNVAKDALTEVEFVKVNDIGDYTSNAPSADTRISLTLSSTSIAQAGGMVNFTVLISTGGEWVISHYDSNTTVSTTAGTGDYTGVWIIPANNGRSSTEWRMTVMADGASATAVLTQPGLEISLEGPLEQGDVSYLGGTRTFRVVCPESNWTVGTEYGGIISSVVPSSGQPTSGTIITATVEPNPDPSMRQAYIYIQVPGSIQDRSSYITQQAGGGAAISVTPDYVRNFASTGGTITAELYSTEEWYALPSPSGSVSVSPTSGTSGTTNVTVTVTPNTGSARSVAVYFYRDSSISGPAIITISQEAYEDPATGDTAFYFINTIDSSTATTMNISTESAGAGTILNWHLPYGATAVSYRTSSSWITSVVTAETGCTVWTEANGTGSARTAELTFTANSGSSTEIQLSLTQREGFYFRWISGIGEHLSYNTTAHTITWDTNASAATIYVSNSTAGVSERLDATSERSLTVTMPVNSGDTELAYWCRGYYGTNGRMNGYYYQKESGSTVDYEKQFLTLEILSGGTIYIVPRNGKGIVYYTKNPETAYITKNEYYVDDAYWTNQYYLENAYTPIEQIPVSAGDEVLFRETSAEGQLVITGGTFVFSASTGTEFNVKGNIYSLITGQASPPAAFPPPSAIGYAMFEARHFSGLFAHCPVVSAEHLFIPYAEGVTGLCSNMFFACDKLVKAPAVLPSAYNYKYAALGVIKPLPSECYANMFANCTSLTRAPELPMSSLTMNCYSNMFWGCDNLNYVKCLATDVQGTNYTSEWLRYVSPTGTFVKASGTTWPTGMNGIPSGWTVQEE